MSKVLFAYERNIATVSIMYEMFGNEIVAEYGMEVMFRSVKQIRKGDLKACDVLFLIRPNNHFSAFLAKNAYKSGKFVITFCDDDLLNLPKNLPNIPWRKKALACALKNSHMVCSSNRYICQKYANKTVCNRFAVLNTALSQTELSDLQAVKLNLGNKVSIVYAAGSGHAVLFEKFVLPIMDQLVANYKDRICFTFVGVHPDLKQYEDKLEIQYIDSMPLAKYRQYMRNSNFDIGLAPLYDDEFSKCKYFNKFIEYTLSGTVGIYSDVEPYTFVVENEKNGFLADNNTEAWGIAIKKAVEDSALRQGCWYNACKKLEEEFGLPNILHNLISDIPELNEYSAIKRCGNIAFAKIRYKILRLFDMLYTALFSLFHGGVRGLIKKMRMHRRDKKSQMEIEVKK